jgi:hypothetical protein
MSFPVMYVPPGVVIFLELPQWANVSRKRSFHEHHEQSVSFL